MASSDSPVAPPAVHKLNLPGGPFVDRYRIERELGAGGMATVYLAEDLRHHRRVAIKLLHPELSAMLGPDRFLKEIELTANLQHPHILPLFDSGSADGLLYYVMPFVDGETLRARLERERQLPIADALRIARETADALAYAHARGVVHRDIKPENILLQDGHALVADFGIALAVQQAGGQRMTQTGLSLGTPQYMSPEQAMGEKNVDARSDIYALGAVTYEMLCGDPPFTGSSVQAIMARAMTERPAPMRTVRETVPPPVEAAVMKALAKLPADRFATASEFAAALTRQDAEERPLRGTDASDHVMLGLGAAIVVLAAALALVLIRGTTSGEPFPVRSVITTPGVAQAGYVAMSPDGHTIAFVGTPDGTTNASANGALVYVRRLDQVAARAIPGTQGAESPAFSPDGSSLVYIANRRQVVKVALDGSAPVVLANVADDGGVTWSSRGDIVVGAGIVEGGQGLFRVNPAGGPLLPLTHVNTRRGELSHEWPVVLPDGNTTVFTIWFGTPDRAELGVTSLDRGTVVPLGVLGARAIGFVDGWLLYVRADGMLMAVPFDPRRSRVAGAPIAVQDSVYIKSGSGGLAGAFVTPAGGLVFARGDEQSQLRWVDRAGHATSAVAGAHNYKYVRLSPDGRRIAATIGRGNESDIWILDIASGSFAPLTTSGSARNPAWSADGRRVLYVSTQGGRAGFWWQPSDGSGGPVSAGIARHNPWIIDLSPDNKTVVFNALYDGSFNLEALGLDSAHVERDLEASPTASESAGRFSPDGRYIAYVSTESGRPEIYVRPFPGNGERVAVSVNGGTRAIWSPDGTKLYYWESNRLVVATLATQPTLHVVSRATLFAGPYSYDYDVSRDGSRFLMIEPSAAGLSIVAIPNWRTELHRLTSAASGGQ